jgi:hypothetical protein
MARAKIAARRAHPVLHPLQPASTRRGLVPGRIIAERIASIGFPDLQVLLDFSRIPRHRFGEKADAPKSRVEQPAVAGVLMRAR